MNRVVINISTPRALCHYKVIIVSAIISLPSRIQKHTQKMLNIIYAAKTATPINIARFKFL